jgi:aspartate carbamoyltransferase catalytic subunit
MHPGPVNWGVELEASLLNYDKSLILEQVAHGMKIRSRLLYDLLR